MLVFVTGCLKLYVCQAHSREECRAFLVVYDLVVKAGLHFCFVFEKALPLSVLMQTKCRQAPGRLLMRVWRVSKKGRTYFKIQGTYFKICALNFFFAQRGVKKRPFSVC